MKPALRQPIREKPWSRPVYPLVENVNHRPARRCLRREGLRQEQRRPQINCEMAIEAFPIKIPDLIGLELGGVVDKEGQRADRGDGGGHQASYSIVIREVGSDDAGTPAIADNVVA